MITSPYDQLYKNSPDNILWDDKPGRLILKLYDYLKEGSILDLGCGDGKNALFLEQNGYEVIGYDNSEAAIIGLKNRFKKNHFTPKGIYEVKDISELELDQEFDALVSYGLMHALPKASRVQTHLKLQQAIRDRGLLVFTCLTDKISMPVFHNTQNIDLVSDGELEQLLINWKILYREDGEITETHPTVPLHQHSAVWIIAEKLT